MRAAHPFLILSAQPLHVVHEVRIGGRQKLRQTKLLRSRHIQIKVVMVLCRVAYYFIGRALAFAKARHDGCYRVLEVTISGYGHTEGSRHWVHDVRNWRQSLPTACIADHL